MTADFTSPVYSAGEIMKQQLQLFNHSITLCTCNTVIVGSGAAAFNAADTLFSLGQTDIIMVTNGINRGTSRNTGSDKQTYYKLSLAGKTPDSIHAMAKDLWNGGCADGDIALCEAALSAKCFYKLCSIGVDFPQNQYGEYIGYQTDHDTTGRATSIGPLTSKCMTEQLQKEVANKKIPILNNHQIIGIFTNRGEAEGILCYTPDASPNYYLFLCKNIVYATGGPAALYARSVYPESQIGATGIALEAGVKGKNLTEWQFGLASVSPRWNVSGTYMQALPRIYSKDEKGNEHEFLDEHFKDYGTALSYLFQKGYQWPFDVNKLNGSSLIDLLVYRQTAILGRKVYLDFTKNPLNQPLDFTALSQEAYKYLSNASALLATPIERLIHMNRPAYQLYLDKGIDLKDTPLEIDVCAQHNNGGLDINCWWESNIKGFFPCGEAAGSHGVYRPGGSALNAGQVGSTRAAQYIAKKRTDSPVEIQGFLNRHQDKIQQKLQMGTATPDPSLSPSLLLSHLQTVMSKQAGIVRDPVSLEQTLNYINHNLSKIHTIGASNGKERSELYYYYDLLLCAKGYVTAMLDFSKFGLSRSSALYPNPNGKLSVAIPEYCRYQTERNEYTGKIQETLYNPETGQFTCSYRSVRPIPQEDVSFETVWRTYRENKNIQ